MPPPPTLIFFNFCGMQYFVFNQLGFHQEVSIQSSRVERHMGFLFSLISCQNFSNGNSDMSRGPSESGIWVIIEHHFCQHFVGSIPTTGTGLASQTIMTILTKMRQTWFSCLFVIVCDVSRELVGFLGRHLLINILTKFSLVSFAIIVNNCFVSFQDLLQRFVGGGFYISREQKLEILFIT